MTALMLSAEQNHSESVMMLLQSKADSNRCMERDPQWTALLFGAFNGSAEALSVLLGSRADATITDTMGLTAIQYAKVWAAGIGRQSFFLREDTRSSLPGGYDEEMAGLPALRGDENPSRYHACVDLLEIGADRLRAGLRARSAAAGRRRRRSGARSRSSSAGSA